MYSLFKHVRSIDMFNWSSKWQLLPFYASHKIWLRLLQHSNYLVLYSLLNDMPNREKINELSFRRWHFLMLLVRNILFWTMRPTILYNQWFMNYSADECAFRYCIFLLIINIPFKFDRGIVSYSLRFWGLERWSDSVERTLKFTALTSKRYWIPSVLSIDLKDYVLILVIVCATAKQR